MGQNKLESQIREKLNAREIQPSAQAWDRLDAMLTVAEEKKTKRSYGWLYIAASVAVLLTVGMFLFTQKNTGTDNQNIVVETPVKKDSIKKEENKFHQNKENQIVEQNRNQKSEGKNQVAVNQFQSSPEAQPNRSERSRENQIKTINQKQSPNPLINREKRIEFQNSSDVAIKDLPKIQTEEKIIVNNNNSDDFLLAGLDKTASQSANKKSAIKIDAKSLLSQVDGELEQTFREKVIHKISKNYKEVKVALANRNKE